MSPEQVQSQIQNFKNHTRFHPLFHFVVLPLLLLNFIFSIYATIHHWPENPLLHLWWIVMSIVFFLMAYLSRDRTLKAQDRIIRLEERLRLTALLPHADHGIVHKLTCRQLIALRFASDEELPTLALRAFKENLDPKSIKQAILNWRVDDHRV